MDVSTSLKWEGKVTAQGELVSSIKGKLDDMI